MAFKPLRMDKREKIIQYRSEGVSIKKTSRLLGISKNTVKIYWRQYQESIQSTEESELDSQQQENIICESSSDKDIRRDKELQTLLPQYYVELRKVGVSRYLLWQEYKQTHPDGYSYSRSVSYTHLTLPTICSV